MKVRETLVVVFLLFFAGANGWNDYSAFLVPVLNFEPFVACNLEDPYNEDDMIGCEFPLLNLTLIRAGWVKGVDYYLQCLEISEAVTNQNNPDSNSLFIGFSTITSARIESERLFGQVIFEPK